MPIEKEPVSTEQSPIVNQLAEELGVESEVVGAVFNALTAKGVLGERATKQITRSLEENLAVIYDISRKFRGRHCMFGVVSDTHLTNKQARLDLLEKAYDVFKKKG